MNQTASIRKDAKYLSFFVLSLGVLMTEIDDTALSVCLPAIKSDLRISDNVLIWLINAYLLAFSGALLPGARLGDMFGYGRVFTVGIVIFTGASLACGLSSSAELLLTARAVQGVGGAVSVAVAYALVLVLFTGNSERGKALAILGFVSTGGRGIALLVGGLLTSSLNWHWVFYINIPVGLLVVVLGSKCLPRGSHHAAPLTLDIGGAITGTAAVVASVYGIVGRAKDGFGMDTRWLVASGALLAIFISIEACARSPLVPLRLFQVRNLGISNLICSLLAGGLLSWYFVVSLYLQLILNYSPLQAGLAILPTNIVMAIFAFGLAARMSSRHSGRLLIVIGLGLSACSLALFAVTTDDTGFWSAIFPLMLILGVGVGIASTPLSLAALGHTLPEDVGAATGVITTTSLVGGTLGVGIIMSSASRHTHQLLALGISPHTAQLHGYQFAFLLNSLFILAATVLGGVFLRNPSPTAGFPR